MLNADGTPMPNALITYAQNPDSSAPRRSTSIAGLTQVRTGNDGRYELRYVRQDRCGMAFLIATRDPSTARCARSPAPCAPPGEQIVLDIAMLGRGSVTGVVRGLNGATVAGATSSC